MSKNQGMRAVVQRVTSASVRVAGAVVGACGPGLLVLVGVESGDDEATAAALAAKLSRLRIFPDSQGRFDLSVLEVSGEVLVVSQFTLLGDTHKGNRPSFTRAAPPEVAAGLVTHVVTKLRALGLTVGTGEFGAAMEVELVNDGPVTIVLDV